MAISKFRVKALCRLKHGNADITRVLDATDEDGARLKMRDRFHVITFHWVKRVSKD